MIDPEVIMQARREMTASNHRFARRDADAADGGCGVIGLAAEIPVAGSHLFNPRAKRRNRGKGRGGEGAVEATKPAQCETE